MVDTSHYYAAAESWKDYIIKFSRENATVIIGLLMLLIRLVKMYNTTFSPIKEVEGSLVQTIRSADEWKAGVKKALEEDKVIVVDWFANWCPPCKKAAPVYAQLSKDYERFPVTFWKIDVDALRGIAVDQNVGSLPTFRIYKKGPDGKLLQAESIEGWREATLRSALETHCALADGVKKDIVGGQGSIESKKDK